MRTRKINRKIIERKQRTKGKRKDNNKVTEKELNEKLFKRIILDSPTREMS